MIRIRKNVKQGAPTFNAIGHSGVSLDQVSKYFGKIKVLDQINVNIDAGECVVLVGKNGSGKSTLLRILAGVLLPDSGRVGKTNSPHMYASDVLPRLPFTAEEYLSHMGRIRGIDSKQLSQRIQELSNLLSLDSAMDQKLPFLSKGTLQKVNLAQALLPGPGGLLLLDEPLSGLDISAQEALTALLEQWKQAGTTIITICHEPKLVERVADRVLLLRGGCISRQWTPEELLLYTSPSVVHIQGRSLTEQSTHAISKLEEQDGVLSVTSHPDSSHVHEVYWAWKVASYASDQILRAILEAGGSIISVHQDQSSLRMESLLEEEA
ncbi:Vitamin B12 import ATP-binding protein BtuD [Paenibacillus sp. JJ-100]|uniref:ATP-binding cassette domain-containing protein n=1 Tax=Paenibacillus sp. JJ-100 TaxID=2974896 RepID=UPI0022FF9293|nr:ABC transporter ATP-binding protein [Paenibacillus sp. JJ-100]CAI6034125.1 Vitamin B12 import ATP-binding protein BtuD [Paenibacillus sp. JJ-100]